MKRSRPTSLISSVRGDFIEKSPSFDEDFSGGDGEIWTLAPVARPTPLAGAPLRPLEYISEWNCELSSQEHRLFYHIEAASQGQKGFFYALFYDDFIDIDPR